MNQIVALLARDGLGLILKHPKGSAKDWKAGV
jgi:hypothetical protein